MMTKGDNRKLTCGNALAGYLFVAGVCALLVIPGAAFAGSCGNGKCGKNETSESCPVDCDGSGGGGGGGGGGTKIIFDVSFTNHSSVGSSYEAPTYLPSCDVIQTGGIGTYGIVFDRHDLCATVAMSEGNYLTDDISVAVNVKKGLITSLQLKGQDIIGEDGIMHASEAVMFDDPQVEPTNSGFTLHIHADNLPIWKLQRHLGGKPVEVVGHISLGDMVYTPRAEP